MRGCMGKFFRVRVRVKSRVKSRVRVEGGGEALVIRPVLKVTGRGLVRVLGCW